MVVSNSSVSIYSRLWCVLEMKIAMDRGLEVIVPSFVTNAEVCNVGAQCKPPTNGPRLQDEDRDCSDAEMNADERRSQDEAPKEIRRRHHAETTTRLFDQQRCLGSIPGQSLPRPAAAGERQEKAPPLEMTTHQRAGRINHERDAVALQTSGAAEPPSSQGTEGSQGGWSARASVSARECGQPALRPRPRLGLLIEGVVGEVCAQVGQALRVQLVPQRGRHARANAARRNDGAHPKRLRAGEPRIPIGEGSIESTHSAARHDGAPRGQQRRRCGRLRAFARDTLLAQVRLQRAHLPRAQREQMMCERGPLFPQSGPERARPLRCCRTARPKGGWGPDRVACGPR